ncbi:MAG: shikimate dehydrogenase family protein [Vulcanisaeta sp. AZ3]|jgi:shikimate dehydrogenase
MQVYSVIGYPLNYTLSPAIHNYVFKALGKDAIYIPLKVTPERLRSFVEFSRDALSGFNVTMPHKIPIVGLLDGVIGAASTLGSVNTVINVGGKLLGWNTDYDAIKQSLSERGYSGEDAIMVGAGGVARAVILALRDLGCRRVYVINRTVSKANELCGLAETLGLDCKALGLFNIDVRAWLFINATPLGTNEDYPIDPRQVNAGFILDLAYTPSGDTALVRLARGYSIPYVDGLEILIRQALMADRIWFGDFNKPSWRDVLESLHNQG